MAKELKPLDITSDPELLRLAEEVRNSGESRVLTRADEELAVVSPMKSIRRRRAKKGPFTKDDALWDIVGIGRSEGPTDVSENKHRYLAEAYADFHE